MITPSYEYQRVLQIVTNWGISPKEKEKAILQSQLSPYQKQELLKLIFRYTPPPIWYLQKPIYKDSLPYWDYRSPFYKPPGSLPYWDYRSPFYKPPGSLPYWDYRSPFYKPSLP